MNHAYEVCDPGGGAANTKTRKGEGSARSRGFTLIELVIVITIMGILAAVSMPSMSGMSAGRTDLAAVRLAADIRYARALALSTHTATSVVVNAATEVYTVYEDDTAGTIAKNPVTQTAAGFVITYGSLEFSGVSIASADFGGDNKLVWSAEGLPDSSGTAVVTGNGVTWTVSVNAAGRVQVQ